MKLIQIFNDESLSAVSHAELPNGKFAVIDVTDDNLTKQGKYDSDYDGLYFTGNLYFVDPSTEDMQIDFYFRVFLGSQGQTPYSTLQGSDREAVFDKLASIAEFIG